MKFKPGWKMTLFVLVMLPILISLGSWQISRAAEKRVLIEAFMDKVGGLALDASSLQPGDTFDDFQRVRMVGQFKDEIFLLDNQVYKGDVGYWVLQVFETTQDQRFIANRGFIPAPKMREKLPQIPPVVQNSAGAVTATGVVWPFTGLIPLWADETWSNSGTSIEPVRVQRLDMAKMAASVNAYDKEIRLEDGQPGILQAAPMNNTFDEAKHLGYAATWFGLAITLFIGFVVVGIRGGRE